MLEKNQKVVLLAAREVTAARTGRIAVLETAVNALQAAGYPVEVIAITNSEGVSTWLGCPVHRVSTPSIITMPFSAVRSLASRKTLNEALFDSQQVRNSVKAICDQIGATVVIGDNIRTWEAAQATGLPVVMHLDDLLSARYASTEFKESNDSVFGYFGEQIPGFIRPLLEGAVKHLLGVEAKLAYRREIQIAREAAVTALTSEAEADVLALRAQAPVLGLPMAVPQNVKCTPSNNAAEKLVFLGVMHYGPNMGALRYLRDEVLPVLADHGRKVEVTVIGKADAEQMAEFEGTPITFKGYVENLHAELSSHRVFVSPIQSGTGVKTKVLDALSVGIPVVATPLGVAGIPSAHGDEYLVGHDAIEFAHHIEYLMDNPDRADVIGAAGYELLGRSMNPQKVYDDWESAVIQATEGKDVYA
ncbi:glycosyltransferase [Rothia nasimurium]|uniref:glycosyltransferase n=1 Tax=Rothia nasimurium TaxID=85336 RepID=UPI001F365C35|nr:glycosyltransferase [Rothia nasimurium]